MKYYHVDVFSKKALLGNGLTVFIYEGELNKEVMQQIATEMKQFETIYLKKLGKNLFSAKIFTVEEELDFAGHPVLGAAGIIHRVFFEQEDRITINLQLNNKKVRIVSGKEENFYFATMNQGEAVFGEEESDEWRGIFLPQLNLVESDLHDTLPMQVVSTGLPYLVIPLKAGLEKLKITTITLEKSLHNIGAKFVYPFLVTEMEGRTWDNLGTVEDVATGSAAGSVGAYLYEKKVISKQETIRLQQGRFVDRPSQILIQSNDNNEILVSGSVVPVIEGNFIM